MESPGFVDVTWSEDGSATVYGRLTARDGTGEAIVGQGRCLKHSDVASITFKTYDVEDPDTIVNSGTVDVPGAVFDALQTSDDDPAWPYAKGFNFRHDLAPANFPVGGKTYVVEYKITTNGGTVGWARYRGIAVGVHTS